MQNLTTQHYKHDLSKKSIFEFIQISSTFHKVQNVFNSYSTTVIAKSKGMSRSLFYDIPCYVTMDYEKWFFWYNLKKSVHLRFKIMSITCRFQVSTAVLTLYISLACKKSNSGEALLFQVNIPVKNISLISLGNQRY